MNKPQTDQEWADWAATEVMGWKEYIRPPMAIWVNGDGDYQYSIYSDGLDPRWSPYTNTAHAMECLKKLGVGAKIRIEFENRQPLLDESYLVGIRSRRGEISYSDEALCFQDTLSKAIMHAIWEIKNAGKKEI